LGKKFLVRRIFGVHDKQKTSRVRRRTR
jgi:hypothetical protein